MQKKASSAIILLALANLAAGAVAQEASFGQPLVSPSFLGINQEFGLWPDKTVHLVYDPDGAPAALSDPDYLLELVERAAQQWQQVADIRFVIDGIDADLDSGDQGDGRVALYWNAGLGQRAGQAGPVSRCTTREKTDLGYCPYVDGILELNPTTFADWDVASFRERELVQVVAHEMGHLLGLGHGENPLSVMFADPYNHLHYPRQDDITAMQALYGPPLLQVTPPAYVLPATGTDPFETSFLFRTDQTNQPLTALDSSAGAVSVGLHLRVRGPFDRDLQVVVTDPDGFFHQGYGLPTTCPGGSICTRTLTFAPAALMLTLEGIWQVHVLANDRRLVSHTLTVGKGYDWNRPPSAALSLSRTAGEVPLSVRATATVGADPEGDDLTLVWHIPGQGAITRDLSAAGGRDSRTLTFDATGTYTVFVEVLDSASHYLGAGDGFKSLLRQEIVVRDSDLDDDGMSNEFEQAHGLDPEDPTDALADLDGDGLSNLEEFRNGTDPTSASEDRDGDGIRDALEIRYGLDPLDPADAARDGDGDGLSSLEEVIQGRHPAVNEGLLVLLILS